MRKILVTGAAGFIGACVCEELLKNKDTIVVGVDNLNNYYDIRLKEYRLHRLQSSKLFLFCKGDIESKPFLRQIFKDYAFDAVINLAARAGVRYSVEYPELYMATNMGGNLNVLELMREFGVKKYVMASTSSLYAGAPMPFKETLDVNRPISPYAASKKGAEMTAYTYHYLHGIDVSILRYFTVYGPAGRPDMSPFRFIEWIQSERPIQLFGDGSQRRDFTYVQDIAQGTIKALKMVGFETINLGNNQPFSLNRVIQMMEEVLGKKANIENLPFQKTDMKHTWADIQKAQDILQWQPEVGFEEGLQKTIAWHLSNRDLILSMNFLEKNQPKLTEKLVPSLKINIK